MRIEENYKNAELEFFIKVASTPSVDAEQYESYLTSSLRPATPQALVVHGKHAPFRACAVPRN